MRVLLKGAVGDDGIEGRDLIGIANTLARMGADVHFAPGHVTPPLPPSTTALLTKSPQDSYDLMISTSWVNTFKGAKVRAFMGCSPWNLSGKDFNLVLHKDPGTATGLKDVTTIPFTSGFDVATFPSVHRDWSEPLRFMVSPQGSKLAMAAFDELYDTHPEMMEKAKPQLAVVDYLKLNTPTLAKVVKDFHCLICADEKPNIQQEFMSSGGLVTALYKGAHIYWLNNLYSHRFHNQDPTSLAAALVPQIEHPDVAKRKAYVASASVQNNTWEQVLSRLFLSLEDRLEEGKYLRAAFLRLETPPKG